MVRRSQPTEVVITAYKMGVSSFEGNIVLMSSGGEKAGELVASRAFPGRGFYFTLISDSPLPVVQTFHHTDNRVSFGQMYSRVVACSSA